jgi:hypothetical protein
MHFLLMQVRMHVPLFQQIERALLNASLLGRPKATNLATKNTVYHPQFQNKAAARQSKALFDDPFSERDLWKSEKERERVERDKE